MIKRTSIAAIGIAAVLSGCSSTSMTQTEIAKDQLKAAQVKQEAAQAKAEKLISAIPSWVLEPPQNDAFGVYGVGIGESRDLSASMKKSQLNAHYELAKAFGQEVSGNEQNYLKESANNSTTQYTQLIDSIVDSIPMSGFETVKHEMVTMDGKFTSYRLMRLSYEQFNKALETANTAATQQEIKSAFADLQERLAKRKVEAEQPQS